MNEILKKYANYYKRDLEQTGINNKSIFYRMIDRRFKFYKSLRMTECFDCLYKKNGSILIKFIRNVLLVRHIRICDKFGWIIPINVFGPGLSIVHTGTIVVNGNARIGENCRIHVCTNIGQAPINGISGAPSLGNNVYIGPGAKLFGPITIGDNVVIGANSVVNKSFGNSCTIAGAPAKVISSNDSSVYIK